MRLFNFFKKKTDKKNEKKEIGQEIISFSEIKNWIEKKESEIELKEKEIIALIKEKINFFVSDIKEKRDILLLISIGVRGLIGLSLVLPWKADANLLIMLVGAIAFGKAFGGVLGDRLGWKKVALSGLTMAAILLTFFH